MTFWEKVNNRSAILALVYCLSALLFLVSSKLSLTSCVWLFSCLLAITGMFQFNLRNNDSLNKLSQNVRLSVGCVDLMLSTLLIYYRQSSVAIQFILAIWVLMNTVIAFFTLDKMEDKHSLSYYLSVMVEIVGLMIGSVLLLDPTFLQLGQMTLIGCYFLLIGCNDFFLVYLKNSYKNRNLHIKG